MKLNENEQKELIELCAQMIASPSLSGHEDGMVCLIKTYMEEHGFDEVFTDRYGNILGCIRGNRPGKHILFDGHIDTVPAENTADWHSDPFTPTIKDGKLYGRGASDMKGADAAMLYALGRFAKESGKNFAGELWFAGVVHEECFEGISAREISKRVRPDLVIIGEASEMNLKCSQRGRAEIKLETFGVPCHSSNPGKGVNAVYAMMKAVEKFRVLPPIRQEGMAGDGIMELTDIISEPFPGKSVVPHYCAVTFDRRLLVGETRESVLAPLQKILDELSAEDPTFRAKVSFTEGSETCYTGETIAADRFFPAWREDPENPLIQRIYREICSRGYSPKLSGYSFCTNGSHYGGEAGIPCLGIGPGREDLAHIIDEYVPIEDLIDIADFYDAVCKAATKEPETD